MLTYSKKNLSYQHTDHSTNLPRAIAWYADEHWPRNGSELDNFLGSGSYMQMEGSHLCHHILCLVHLYYEFAEINLDRNACHRLSKYLRQAGEFVPEGCDKHQSPCVMREASLTTFERHLHQFFCSQRSKRFPSDCASRKAMMAHLQDVRVSAPATVLWR